MGRHGGGWETITNYPGPGAPAAVDLDLSFARWIAALEHATSSSDDDGDTGEVDLELVDWLFTQDWE